MHGIYFQLNSTFVNKKAVLQMQYSNLSLSEKS